MVLVVGFCLDAPLAAALLDLPLGSGLSFSTFPVDPLVECRVVRFVLGSSTVAGCELMRPDLRRPFSWYDVGPSASIFFHGGDMGFSFRTIGGGVEFRVLCLLFGRSPSLS